MPLCWHPHVTVTCVPVDKKSKSSVGGATSGSSRNLWVSGLSSSTRATDLKQVFSKYGKVRHITVLGQCLWIV